AVSHGDHGIWSEAHERLVGNPHLIGATGGISDLLPPALEVGDRFHTEHIARFWGAYAPRQSLCEGFGSFRHLRSTVTMYLVNFSRSPPGTLAKVQYAFENAIGVASAIRRAAG